MASQRPSLSVPSWLEDAPRVNEGYEAHLLPGAASIGLSGVSRSVSPSRARSVSPILRVIASQFSRCSRLTMRDQFRARRLWKAPTYRARRLYGRRTDAVLLTLGGLVRLKFAGQVFCGFRSSASMTAQVWCVRRSCRGAGRCRRRRGQGPSNVTGRGVCTARRPADVRREWLTGDRGVAAGPGAPHVLVGSPSSAPPLPQVRR
jgi:hypothetical protein